MPDYPIPPEQDDPKLRRFFDYWAGKHRHGRLPARADIDPVEIPGLLGHIVLVSVTRPEGRILFQYTLWGTKVAQIFGRDFTGHYLDDIIIPTRVDEIRTAFKWVVDNRKPHFWQIPVPIENREFVSTRRLLVPLAGDGHNVDHLAAILVGVPRTT